MDTQGHVWDTKRHVRDTQRHVRDEQGYIRDTQGNGTLGAHREHKDTLWTH